MRSLRLAMIADGIPTAETALLAAALDMQDIGDIEKLNFFHLMRVPHTNRFGILAMRNRYKRAGDADWNIPADVNWDLFDHLLAEAILQLAEAN